MCLADLGPVLSIADDGATATVDLAGRHRQVSLAPLVLEGQEVTSGDWLVVHTGLAVELLEEADALEVVARRAALGEVPAGDWERSTHGGRLDG